MSTKGKIRGGFAEERKTSFYRKNYKTVGAEVKKKSICHSKLVFRREKSIGSDGPRFESPWFGI